jgi:hypothetical protein
MHLVARPTGEQSKRGTIKRDRSRTLYGYEKHAITARAKSALKSGASVTKNPPAVAAPTIAAIWGVIILQSPLNLVGKPMPRKTSTTLRNRNNAAV